MAHARSSHALRKTRGPSYPGPKKARVCEALSELFHDRLRKGQDFRQLTRKALQPELEAIVRELTADDPSEIALNREEARTSYRNMVKYIFENEFRKGGLTARPGARSSAGKGGSPARGFAKKLAKAHDPMADLGTMDGGTMDGSNMDGGTTERLMSPCQAQNDLANNNFALPGGRMLPCMDSALSGNISTFEFSVNHLHASLDTVDENVVDNLEQDPLFVHQHELGPLRDASIDEPADDTDCHTLLELEFLSPWDDLVPTFDTTAT